MTSTSLCPQGQGGSTTSAGIGIKSKVTATRDETMDPKTTSSSRGRSRNVDSASNSILKAKTKTTGPRNMKSGVTFNTDFVKTVTADYKSVTGGSAFRHGILSRIVNKIKLSYLDGDSGLNTLEELLKLSGQQDVSKAVKQWLEKEELPRNKSITVTSWADGTDRYEYKPPLPCTNQKELLQFLKEYQKEEKGGILEEEILASVPHGERVIKALAPHLHFAIRSDKKRVVFYENENMDCDPDLSKYDDDVQIEKVPFKKEFLPNALLKSMWQSFSLTGYSDDKVEDVLLQNGLQPVFGSRSLATHNDMRKNSNNYCNGNNNRLRQRRKLPVKFNFRNNVHVQDLERYEYDQPL